MVQPSSLPAGAGPIGVFDSGFGGLTVLKNIRTHLSQYDHLFLGDNARAPYGTRSFDVVYQYTLQGVKTLFEKGCHLVILACNTASAKALRTIQQHDLSQLDPHRRVLGIIRPTVEAVGALTRTRHVGLLATPGTVSSQSYDLEICKLHPDIRLSGLACPMWVPLVENFEYDKPGADYFVKDRLDNLFQKDPLIDTLLLGCTHYPFLLPKIERYTPAGVRIITQGEYVARSLEDYLRRHPEMDAKCSRRGSCSFLTTEDADNFNTTACLFLQEKVHAHHIVLEE